MCVFSADTTVIGLTTQFPEYFPVVVGWIGTQIQRGNCTVIDNPFVNRVLAIEKTPKSSNLISSYPKSVLEMQSSNLPNCFVNDHWRVYFPLIFQEKIEGRGGGGEERRDREREQDIDIRETHRLVASSTCLNQGQWSKLQPRYVFLTRNWIHDP